MILFVDDEGKVGVFAPAHIDNELPKLKVGVTIGLTVTLNVAGNAHCPAEGVNV